MAFMAAIVCPSLHVFVVGGAFFLCLPVCLSVCLSAYLSVGLFVCLLACESIYVYIVFLSNKMFFIIFQQILVTINSGYGNKMFKENYDFSQNNLL